MFCTRLSMLVSATVVFLAIGPLQPNLGAAPGDDETARFDTYDSPDGETYFALSLKLNFQLPPSDAHDIVVLFDTSASQAGPYRDKALAALERLLARLRPNGAAPNRSVRVRLMAVDLDAVPMQERLAAANDPQLDAAVAKLKKRVPLGSTDMLRALEGAIAGFDSPRGADRTIIYIGDGMSRASLIESQPFASLVGKLVSKRISVSSYAIGPQIDARLLAVLANHTGGNLAVDAEMAWPDPQQKIDAQQARIENERYAHKIGDFLATGATTGAVLWPTAATWPKSLDEVYPTAVPPLRNDRASVVVGTGKLHGPMAVEMKADLHGKETELSWSARPQHSGEHNAYLAQLVKQARRDDGISLPTLGAAGLQEAARMASAEVNDLTKLARHAVVTGNTPNAELLAAEALRRDPGNVMAEAIRDSAGHLRTVSAQHSTRDLEMRQPAGHAKTPPEPQDGAALDGFVANRRVVAEMVEKEVRIELERARDRMSDDPEGVTQALKLQMERVRQVTELDPDTRARLTSELEAALRETDRRQIIYDEAQRERQERIAQAREQARLTDRLVRDQSLLRELIVRMGSLVDEGNYQTAEDVVGPEAAALDYYGATNVYHGSVSRAAILEARFEHWISRGRELVSARQRGVLAALDTVEASAIPQSDEPPVVYPPREFWLDITNRRKKWASVDLKKRGSAEEKISAALDETTKVDFLETPLSDAMLFLQDRHNIPIQLDQRGLDEAGLGSDTPISLNVSGISLKSALRLMLRPLDLTYTIQDEVLQITTRATIEDELTTRVYPVADLVLPIQVTGGGFGGGFGGGGIGGGGGFGGQGGGFGGQGGGFGGQGGGFGGGGQGFFTVNDEIHGQASPKTTDQELRLLKSDPKKPAATTAPPRDEAPLAKPRPAKSAEPIQPIAIDDRLPADVFWNKYFADDTRDEPAVRQAVRDLLAKRNFEHIIALCQAALRGGHAQPWMYETMALAMQAAGQSQNEVERALMSAADFAQTPSDLMYLAEYLSRIGLEVRALQVVREVAKLDPTNAAAYGYAFELGERLDDLDTQRWATRKVLSRSWPSRQRALFDKAHRVALSIEARLKEEGRADEAAAFRADLDAALVRDCVVLVSWTGDADIDLMVEEPTGTVCSLRNPVTSGGGVMVGDPSVQYGSSSESESQEIYTCAQGFPGAYRVMLRRVWGNVTAGKVTVDVYTNYRSGEVQHERQQIPVGEKDAVVLFDVKQGRRTEPAEQQRVEQAANTQLAVSRSVLAQQLSSISDPRIADEIARRRGFLPDARLARGGAVGFQPVITVLPAGTTLSAFGVISADRRYVRVTPTPFFSAIGDVTTFTFAGGAAPVGGAGGGTGF